MEVAGPGRSALRDDVTLEGDNEEKEEESREGRGPGFRTAPSKLRLIERNPRGPQHVSRVNFWICHRGPWAPSLE